MILDATTTLLMDLADNVVAKANDSAGVATDGGRDLWFSFLGINWATPTWDIIILLFVILSVLIYSFTLGRDRIVALLISTYLSLAVATNLPYMEKLNELINSSGFSTFKISAFLIVFASLFIILSRSSLLQGLSNLSGGWWQIILFSLLQVGLTVSVVLSFIPHDFFNRLSPFTQIIFTSDLGKFCWIVLPILALVFIHGRRSKYSY